MVCAKARRFFCVGSCAHFQRRGQKLSRVSAVQVLINCKSIQVDWDPGKDKKTIFWVRIKVYVFFGGYSISISLCYEFTLAVTYTIKDQ